MINDKNANVVGAAKSQQTGGAETRNNNPYGTTFGGGDWETEATNSMFVGMSNDADAGEWTKLFRSFLEEVAPSLKQNGIEISVLPVDVNNDLATIGVITRFSKTDAAGEETFVFPLGVVPENFHATEKQVQITVNAGGFNMVSTQITKTLPQPANTLLNNEFVANTVEAVRAQAGSKAVAFPGLLTPQIDPTRDVEAAKKFVKKIIAECCRIVTESRGKEAPSLLGQVIQINESFAASSATADFQKASREIVDGSPVRADATVRVILKGKNKSTPMGQVNAFVELLSGPKRGSFLNNNIGNFFAQPVQGIHPGILRSEIRITNFGMADYSKPKAWYAAVLINMLRLAMDSSGKFVVRTLAPNKDSQIGKYNRRNLGALDHEVMPGIASPTGGRFHVRDTVAADERANHEQYLLAMLDPTLMEASRQQAAQYVLPASMVSFDYREGSVEGSALRVFRLAAMSDDYINQQPDIAKAALTEQRQKANEVVTRIFDELTSGQFSIEMASRNQQNGLVFTDNNRMIAFGTYLNEANEVRDIRELDTLAWANYVVQDTTSEYPFDHINMYESTIAETRLNAEARLAFQLDHWRNAGRTLNVTGLGWVISFTHGAYNALFNVFAHNENMIRQERLIEGQTENGANQVYRYGTALPVLGGLNFDSVSNTPRANNGNQVGNYNMI